MSPFHGSVAGGFATLIDRGYGADWPETASSFVRLRQPNRHKIDRAVMQAMDEFAQEEWPGLLVVVRDTIMSISRATLRNNG